MDIPPRHVVCLLHDGSVPVESICQRFPGFEFDAEYSQREPDPRMTNAFLAAADRVEPSFSDDDWAAIERHTAVAYVLGPQQSADTAAGTSRAMLAFVAEALRGGAVAAKGESSGIAHGRTQWLALDERAAVDPESALLRAWVRYPIGDRTLTYSCGMHLLGLPDVEIAHEGMSEDELVELMEAFLCFMLIDKPADLASGQNFGLSAEAPPYRMLHVVCDRYEVDDFSFNPYGYWRLAPVS